MSQCMLLHQPLVSPEQVPEHIYTERGKFFTKLAGVFWSLCPYPQSQGHAEIQVLYDIIQDWESIAPYICKRDLEMVHQMT